MFWGITAATRRELTRGESGLRPPRQWLIHARFRATVRPTLVTVASLKRIHRSSIVSAALLAFGAVQGCGDKPREEAPAAKTEALAQAKPVTPPAMPATADAPVADTPAAPAERPKYPRPGFSVVSVAGKSPICLFASEAERQLAPISHTQAKKQTLRAGASIIIGAYPPWCIHESCDDRPSLQCWIDLQGDTIVVNARYFGDHKDGTTCTENCREINAGCETPPLPAGKYTIQQGEQTWPLRIPSVLKDPCFVPER